MFHNSRSLLSTIFVIEKHVEKCPELFSSMFNERNIIK